MAGPLLLSLDPEFIFPPFCKNFAENVRVYSAGKVKSDRSGNMFTCLSNTMHIQ
jgi:hypothetical protein